MTYKEDMTQIIVKIEIFSMRQYTYEEYKENHAGIAQILVDDANDKYTLSLIESGVL